MAACVVPPVILLVYDFETTGLSTKTAEITQLTIMTVDEMNNRSYSAYFVPEAEISYMAAQITGLAVEIDEYGQQHLTKQGMRVPAVPPAVGMLEFVLFIEKVVAAAANDAMVLLVAHNGRRFDERFLVRYMQRFNIHTHPIWTR
uniref:Exonuclease domain-containing protein n=2 Tax=Plectus sambesii TaxID=2011161 RepID=A0A914V9T6_9BILA